MNDMSTNTKKTVQNILNETNQLINQGKHKEALEILKNQISNKNILQIQHYILVLDNHMKASV